MFFARILVILSSVLDQEAAIFTVRRARESAARPELLRFAVSEKCKPAFEQESDSLMFFQGGLEDAAEWLNGETHFLLLDANMIFAVDGISSCKACFSICLQKRHCLPAAWSAPILRQLNQRNEKSPGSEMQMYKMRKLNCSSQFGWKKRLGRIYLGRHVFLPYE